MSLLVSTCVILSLTVNGPYRCLRIFCSYGLPRSAWLVVVDLFDSFRVYRKWTCVFVLVQINSLFILFPCLKFCRWASPIIRIIFILLIASACS